MNIFCLRFVAVCETMSIVNWIFVSVTFDTIFAPSKAITLWYNTVGPKEI